MGSVISNCNCYNNSKLNNLNKYNNKTPLFTFHGKKTHAKVVKVYDADTIQVVFNVYNNYYRFKCRLNRIDSPEIKSHNPLEKEKAIISRDMLKKRILNKIVFIKCLEFDKYGRILIELYQNNYNLNDWLINNNYAIKYDGGKKIVWNENMLNKIIEKPVVNDLSISVRGF